MLAYLDRFFVLCGDLSFILIGFSLAGGAWLFQIYVDIIDRLLDRLDAWFKKRKAK